MIIKRSFESYLGNVEIVISEILEFLNNNINNLSKEDFLDLKLILNELILNAVIHGNNQDITKMVDIILEIKNDNIIEATISDEGDGYNYKEVMVKYNDTSLLDESGRGMLIVSSLIDNISFNDRGNIVNFTKKVNIL